MSYHIPVLLNESVSGLNIRPSGIYVDVTFGGGGHSRAILEKLTNGRLIGLDIDHDALANAPQDKRLIVERGNFYFLRNYLAHHSCYKVDGILADLGVSSHHFDDAQRGFTFQNNARLDMRMNNRGQLTAANVIQRYTEDKLRNIFSQYGEVTNAPSLARQIVLARQSQVIESSQQFIDVIQSCIPRSSENKYLAKVYQALRIEVNGELRNLKSLLMQSVELLPVGGRLVVISYHSLEDRLVKNFFKNGMFEGDATKDIYGNTKVPFRQVNSKVIVPNGEEISLNSRARSAKLRIGERVAR